MFVNTVKVSIHSEIIAVSSILCMCLIFLHYRFTKNLSADKINLSTFKGEGELSNLELDEDVLTELLELPSWLRLTSAWCNRVSFRIQWTKLKSVPIFLVSFAVNMVVLIVFTIQNFIITLMYFNIVFYCS
jgi:hypothetical protein